MFRWVQTAIVNFQGELSERHSLASESGSSTDSHADAPDGKDGELDWTCLLLWGFHGCAKQNMKFEALTLFRPQWRKNMDQLWSSATSWTLARRNYPRRRAQTNVWTLQVSRTQLHMAGLNTSQLINFTLPLPSGYLNVLVNSQWRTCWCLIKNGQLWFYQDKSKNKVSQPAVTLEGCRVSADPSPEHLYSFRIEMDGTQLATLEVDHSCF